MNRILLIIFLLCGVAAAQFGSGGSGISPAPSTSRVLTAQTSVAAGDTVASGCTGSGCNFASGSYTFAAGSFCPSVGTVYHLVTAGLLTTTATAGNAGEQLELGSMVIANAQMYENANLSGIPWSDDVWIVCTATGSSGAVEVSYNGMVQSSTSANNGAAVIDNPPNATTIAVNTTQSVTLTSLAHFTASGSATERQFILMKP